jgi:plastocyanin
MKTKLIVLLLILGVVLFSGCTGNEQSSQEENTTPEETVTPEEVTTPEENETPTVTETEEEVETPVVTETAEENVTAEENGTTEENGTEVKTEVDTSYERLYTIRLDNYRASASNLDINEGEAVAWLNYQDSPRRVFTLVSEQGLFENTSLSYKRSFVYTFNETGEYNFTVVGQPKMSVNVTVSES